MTRREFVQATLAGAAAAVAPLAAAETKKPALKKAVKYSMITTRGTTREKFDLAKKLGFEGVEVDSPSALNRHAALEAQEATGVKIHGVIDSIHWNFPLSSPVAAVRAEGLTALRGALEDAKFFGADTVLLVPGVVNREVTFEQCWERSQAEVRKAIPLSEKLGVKIAIEVVWNNFLTTPEQLIKYVDEFKSPVVGAYFDASNMLKYGVPSAEWIRRLGKRMMKFDFKAYSVAKAKAENNEGRGFDVAIGEGDENWPEILKALADVGYSGWATSEVRGGGETELRDIAERMNKCLGLGG